MKSCKTRVLALLTAALLVLSCTACGGKEPTPPVENTPPAAEEQQPATPPAAEEQPPETPPQTEEPAPELPPESQPEVPVFDFSALKDVEFTFYSGAGGWRTVMYIHADGTFDGLYTDSEMGDIGEAYPNGTYYVSEFSGRFEAADKEDDHTWMLEIAELTYAKPFGEEVKDGVRYVYTEAHGVAGAEGLLLFEPGAPMAQLPEFYLNWVGYYDLTQIADMELPFWGLYDPVTENGFASSRMPTPAEQAQSILAQEEARAALLETELQNAQTQLDMNLLSGDLYNVWDDALNSIWSLLRQELDEQTMQQLTNRQLAWIEEKEAAMAAAGAAYEGGSMYALVVNSEAAEWTQQRVYELAAYLK